MSGRCSGIAETGGIIVRHSEPGDMETVCRIYAHHVLHGLATFEEVPPDLVEMNSRRTSILGSGLPYLVAERNGRVTGYAYAALFRTRSAYRHTVENSIFVDAEFAGQGNGRGLLNALISECRDSGYREMLAVIGDSGNRGSIALHRSIGFRHVGTFTSVGLKFGRWVDVVLMQKTLNDVSSPEAPEESSKSPE